MMILGHLPFIGVSYRSSTDGEDLVRLFRNGPIIQEIIEHALDLGITKFTSEPPFSPMSKAYFNILTKICQSNNEAETFPCIGVPLELKGKPLDPLRRWATIVHFYQKVFDKNLLSHFLKDPVLKCRPGWDTDFSQVVNSSGWLKNGEVLDLQLNLSSLDSQIESLDGPNVKTLEFGSEIDLLAIINRWDLIWTLLDAATDRGYMFGLGSHHGGSVLPLLAKNLPELSFVFTPINKMGIMMFPSMHEVLEAVQAASKQFPVIAMKTLGGGIGDVRSCYEYINSVSGISDVIIGVRTVQELQHAVSILSF